MEKKQQGEKKRGNRKRKKEQDRDQQRRMRSRTEMQKKTWDGQYNRHGGKKSRGGERDQERW